MSQGVAPARARVAAFDWVALSLAASCRGRLVRSIPRWKCAIIQFGSLWGVTCTALQMAPRTGCQWAWLSAASVLHMAASAVLRGTAAALLLPRAAPCPHSWCACSLAPASAAASAAPSDTSLSVWQFTCVAKAVAGAPPTRLVGPSTRGGGAACVPWGQARSPRVRASGPSAAVGVRYVAGGVRAGEGAVVGPRAGRVARGGGPRRGVGGAGVSQGAAAAASADAGRALDGAGAAWLCVARACFLGACVERGEVGLAARVDGGRGAPAGWPPPSACPCVSVRFGEGAAPAGEGWCRPVVLCSGSRGGGGWRGAVVEVSPTGRVVGVWGGAVGEDAGLLIARRASAPPAAARRAVLVGSSSCVCWPPGAGRGALRTTGPSPT
jgi:hypothetical protein